MEFIIRKTDAGYHARFYNDAGKLIFWTKDYKTEQKAIKRCEEAKRGAAAAAITPVLPSA
jgi:uncharacterized protein YegP (UPF0339 family)